MPVLNLIGLQGWFLRDCHHQHSSPEQFVLAFSISRQVPWVREWNGGLEGGCLAQATYPYKRLNTPNRGRGGHPGAEGHGHFLVRQKIMITESEIFKSTRHPEDVSPWNTHVRYWARGRTRQKEPSLVLAWASWWLPTLPGLPRRREDNGCLQLQTINIKTHQHRISLQRTINDQEQTQKRNKIVHPKSPTVNVFISCFTKPRI